MMVPTEGHEVVIVIAATTRHRHDVVNLCGELSATDPSAQPIVTLKDAPPLSAPCPAATAGDSAGRRALPGSTLVSSAIECRASGLGTGTRRGVRHHVS